MGKHITENIEVIKSINRAQGSNTDINANPLRKANHQNSESLKIRCMSSRWGVGTAAQRMVAALESVRIDMAGSVLCCWNRLYEKSLLEGTSDVISNKIYLNGMKNSFYVE